MAILRSLRLSLVLERRICLMKRRICFLFLKYIPATSKEKEFQFIAHCFSFAYIAKNKLKNYMTIVPTDYRLHLKSAK